MSELVPLPPMLTLNGREGSGGGVGEERIKMMVEVNVGDGVSVGRVGVTEGVSVEEGTRAAVCVDAALTVCAMKVPIKPGSTVGTAGVPMLNAGAHARISASAKIQITSFVFCVVAIISSSASEQSQNQNSLPSLNDDSSIWKTQAAFDVIYHDIFTWFFGGLGVKVHSIFLARF